MPRENLEERASKYIWEGPTPELIADLWTEVSQLRRVLVETRLVLGPDASGRPFERLLQDIRDYLNAAGGGPMAECLYHKMIEVTTALDAIADYDGEA